MFVAKSHLIRRLVQLLWQSATQFVGRKDPTPPWLRRAASQSQSALLSKLPPEIRLLVWKQCLGGMRLHLYLKQTRCRSLPCRNMDITNKCYGTCWSYQDMVNQSLLLTCRQVCSEAIEILYSANTFDINTNWTLRWLSQKILPQHFHAIRSPRLRWFLPGVPATDIKTEADDFWAFDNEREWRTTWQCLASMQGLKYLHVELYTYSRMIDWRVELSKNDSAVFEHLKAVTRPEHFDLILPSWADFDPSALRDLPCRLRIAVEA